MKPNLGLGEKSNANKCEPEITFLNTFLNFYELIKCHLTNKQTKKSKIMLKPIIY